MAKWGEGDPRWIVEERPDATNVNNWHWTEKNASQWSDDKLRELLQGLEISTDTASCEITKIKKLEGDAVVNNRKGKLIFFYEWDILLDWKGSMNDSDEEIEGQIAIPNLSEENEVHEIDVIVTLLNNSKEGYRVKEFLVAVAPNKIREKLGQYINLLREEFSKGMILPKKGESGTINTKKETSITSLSSGFNKHIQVNPTPKEKPSPTVKSTAATAPANVECTSINLSQAFQCTGEDFYNALTVMPMVQAFTQGPVRLEVKEGGIFELFHGNIHGTFIELVPNKKIVQRWRCKRWPENHYSTVEIKINQMEDHTKVDLLQKDVPKSEADSTLANWERYYWEAMKRTFGFGTFIL